MTARTDFSQLRSVDIARQMGAKLSDPATRVEADAPMTTMRFSRTLDERNPYSRSGSAWIVPMDDKERLNREFDAAAKVLYIVTTTVALCAWLAYVGWGWTA